MTRRRTAILISGRGSNMRALIEAARDPDYPAEIALVLSNRPDAPGLATAKAAGIAVAAIDHKIHAGREDFERSMQAMLEIHRVDLICMAGFMRLVTPWFVSQWRDRMINIHPALLPSFRGLDTHARALAEGVKIHGCTVHFVCRRWTRVRSSPRRRSPCWTATRRKAWGAGCWRRSTGSIPGPWRVWRAAA